MTHKFTVGQIVDVVAMKFRHAATGKYVIHRLMPVEDSAALDPSYHIKGIAKNDERIVREGEITLSTSVNSAFA